MNNNKSIYGSIFLLFSDNIDGLFVAACLCCSLNLRSGNVSDDTNTANAAISE